MGIFNVDSKAYETLTKAADLMIISLLMVLGSLPVVTMGASITAAYYVALKVVKNDEGYIFQSFFQAWKSNLKQGFFMELVLGILTAILCADVKFLLLIGIGGLGTILELIAVGVLFVVIIVGIYAFAVLARFDNTVGATLKNALVLAIRNMKYTIVMFAATCALGYFTVLFGATAILTIPSILFINSYFMCKVFEPYMQGETKAEVAGENV